HRPPKAIPQGTADQVSAAAQRHDVTGRSADAIIGSTADEAVGGGNHATDPGRATCPRHRPESTVPRRTANQVVAVAQDENAVVSHAIIGGGADEAVGLGDDAPDSAGGAPPGHRPAAIRTDYDIVAVGQHRNTTTTNGFIGIGADQAIDGGYDPAYPSGAAAPR